MGFLVAYDDLLNKTLTALCATSYSQDFGLKTNNLCISGPVVRPRAARAKDPGFDSPIAQHVQRFISRDFTYGAVGSLVLSWSWAAVLKTWVHFLLVPLESIM